MPALSTYGPTGDAYIDGVLSGVKWAVTSLTYSFPASASFYGSNYGDGEPTNNFGVLNLAQQAAVRATLANITSSVNITFTEVTETSSTHGALRYARSDAPNTAWAYYPDPAGEGGDSWYNRYSGSYDTPVKGNYAYTTFLHETGHALGLDHAHEGYVMPISHDSMEYTAMSYRSYIGASVYQGYTNENWGYAQSLMIYDIAALQSVYGANYATNNGDTGYTWSLLTGEMFINGIGQGAAGGNRIFQTVWDGGGMDTYDLSNYTAGVTVDLHPGGWSVTSAAQLARLHYNGSQIAAGNIANALLYGGSLLSIIENARGGTGHDRITGNQAANILWGNAGNDTLMGADGHDMLLGGAGADRLDGGNGIDAAHYGDARYGVLADLLVPNLNTGDAAGDSYVAIERLFGSEANDNLRGDELANWVYGAAGDDILYGRGGDDTLIGVDGNDILIGGPGADRLDGGNGMDWAHYGDVLAGVVVDLLMPSVNTGEAAGDNYLSIEHLFGSMFNDNLRGDNFANVIYGAAGDDVLYGRGGNDTLMGADSHDMLLGGAGADHLDGGNGIDAAHYGDASAGVVADLFVSSANTGDAAGDSYVSIERLFGSEFNDNLRGDNLANWVYGAAGDDVLYGRGGDDTLMGVDSHDMLLGGAGADHLDGGNGIDAAHYGDASAGVVADLLNPSVNIGDAAGDSYVSIERLFGSEFSDNLRGDDFANWVYGAAGDDILYGRNGDDTLMGVDGNDILIGGAGADILLGGAGSDTFAFHSSADTSPNAGDTILDFLSGVDMIDLRLIDGNTNLAGDQAFSYNGGGFTGMAGELIFAYGVLSGDINGDMSADFEVRAPNVAMFRASDFYL